MGESDDFWVQKAIQDKEAFAELVKRYQTRLYNLAYRITGDREESKDLVQESFLRAYRALPTFRQGSPFSPWLFRIAVNVCLNYLRQRRERPADIVDMEEHLGDGSVGVPEMVEQRETQEVVQKAILRLPEHYRAVILLRHQQDLTYEEMAQVLDMPLGTVKTHLFRAREKLKEILQRTGINT